MSSVADHYAKARRVYHTEGLASLLKRGFRFLPHCVFEYSNYWLHAGRPEDIRELNEADFMPKIAGFSLKIVSSSAEADELEGQGFKLRSQIPGGGQILNSGAIALCIFVGGELANVGWIATTQQAKAALNEPPVKVDFSNGEVYRGGSWTNPRYRGMDLHSYNLFKRMQLSLAWNKALCRSVVDKRNAASQKAAAKLGTKTYGEGRYIRVLWWKSWRERPLAGQ